MGLGSARAKSTNFEKPPGAGSGFARSRELGAGEDSDVGDSSPRSRSSARRCPSRIMISAREVGPTRRQSLVIQLRTAAALPPVHRGNVGVGSRDQKVLVSQVASRGTMVGAMNGPVVGVDSADVMVLELGQSGSLLSGPLGSETGASLLANIADAGSQRSEVNGIYQSFCFAVVILTSVSGQPGNHDVTSRAWGRLLTDTRVSRLRL